MGWLFTHGQTRKELIESLTRPWTGDDGIPHTCVAHTAVGNNLWMVWQIGDENFIVLALMRNQSGYGWGYKAMCEAEHPFYYTCPLSYLDKATETCPPWRQDVRDYHARKKVKVGQKVALVGSTVKWVTILSLRPLIGLGDDGRQYRIPANMLGDKLDE